MLVEAQRNAVTDEFDKSAQFLPPFVPVASRDVLLVGKEVESAEPALARALRSSNLPPGFLFRDHLGKLGILVHFLKRVMWIRESVNSLSGVPRLNIGLVGKVCSRGPNDRPNLLVR